MNMNIYIYLCSSREPNFSNAGRHASTPRFIAAHIHIYTYIDIDI